MAGPVAGSPHGGSALVGPALTIALTFTPLGALVLTSLPGHRVGRLMLAAGGLAGVEVVALAWLGVTGLAWLAQWLWWPPFALIGLALLLFPDGRLPGPRWRWPAALIVAAATLAAVALALAALQHPQTLLTSVEPAIGSVAQALVQVAVLLIGGCVLGFLGVLGALVARRRRADGPERAQVGYLAVAGAVLPAGILLDAAGADGAGYVAAAAVPAAMTLAVLRHRLYDLDWLIDRTIVWLVMTLLVVAGFVGLVTGLRAITFGDATSVASVVATGLVAVAFEPVRRQVQRGVERLLYGQRDDPYALLAGLGTLLVRTADAGAALPALADAVARSLRLPYVAIEVDGDDGPRVVAEHGRAATPVWAVPMESHGVPRGRLLAGVRSPGGRFHRRERRLLRDAAVQAALAVEATGLIRQLQHSRERLVTAREAERRQVRRDIHDGVGSSLAGMCLRVAAARRNVPDDSAAAPILDALAEDLRDCRVELRRLVDRLRPPALDAGLAEALLAEARRFADTDLSLDLTVGGELSDLPAAVEVAAYRVIGEAVANAARHARARTCRVAVHGGAVLTAEVTDDGAGVAAAEPGVGLTSMAERAAELGGSCDVVPAEGGGTTVRLRLPLAGG